MKKRLLSLLLALSMMFALVPAGAFAAGSGASGTVIKLDDIIAPRGAAVDAGEGNYPSYPFGCGKDRDQKASGEGWHYEPYPVPAGGFGNYATRGMLYLEAGYTFTLDSEYDLEIHCDVTNYGTIEGFGRDHTYYDPGWGDEYTMTAEVEIYGYIENHGLIHNTFLRQWYTGNKGYNAADGTIRDSWIFTAYDTGFTNDGILENCFFDGNSSRIDYTLSGSGTVTKSLFYYFDLSTTNTCKDNLYRFTPTGPSGVHSIHFADDTTKFTCELPQLKDVYSTASFYYAEAFYFTGSPKLRFTGSNIMTINGVPLTANATIPGVSLIDSIERSGSSCTVTLTPDGTSDISLGSASGPSPDGTLVLDSSGYPLYSSGDGWSFGATQLNSSTQYALTINENHTIDLTGKTVNVPVSVQGTLKGGVYKEPVYFSAGSNAEGIVVFSPCINLDPSQPLNMTRVWMPAHFTANGVTDDRELYTNKVSLWASNNTEITVEPPAGTSFYGWAPQRADASGSVYTRVDALPGQTSSDFSQQKLTFTMNSDYEGLWFLLEHKITVSAGGISALTEAGAPLEHAAMGDVVYLQADDAAAEELLASLKITAGYTSVALQTTEAGRYYFVMPDGDVTIKDSSSTTDPDTPGIPDDGGKTDPGTEPSDPEVPSTPASSDDGSTGLAVVLGTAAVGGAAYLIGTQVWMETNLPDGVIPTNRQQLADMLWAAADKPEPASAALYADISAEAVESQKAARWCVEQGLVKDHGESFDPNTYTFRPQVIKAWNDLQARKAQ